MYCLLGRLSCGTIVSYGNLVYIAQMVKEAMVGNSFRRVVLFRVIYVWSLLIVRNQYKMKASVVKEMDLKIAISTLEHLMQATSDVDVLVGFLQQVFSRLATGVPLCHACRNVFGNPSLSEVLTSSLAFL